MSESRVHFKRFMDVLVTATCEERTFTLTLSPVQVTALHGALRLIMGHPELRRKYDEVLRELQAIFTQLGEKLREMGFTDEEIEYLNHAGE